MEIVESIEIRWFFRVGDAAVSEIAKSFASVPVEDDERRDHYYLDPQRLDLNAKERTGGGKPPKLEFKYRVGFLGLTRLDLNVTGQVERWTKLTVEGLGPTISAYARSIEVKKSRKLRKFSYAAGAINEVGFEERPEAGRSVELTEISASCGAETRVAVSFGLEAFGPPPVTLDAMLGALRKLRDERPQLVLEERHCLNYSSWLAREFSAGEAAP